MMAYLFALFFGIVAALPLFGSRFIPTHDGEYHIIRFWQFFTVLTSGVWFPRWAPNLNDGFGIPLFTFQYPFPNYVGSLFHLFGISFVDSVKWTLALGYLFALTGCFLWLQKLFGRRSAIIGTIVGAYVPYWFVDIYIRGSVGEVWAIAWVFAACAAMSYGKHAITAVAVGLLVLSHNIIALTITPLLVIYAFLYHRRFLTDILLGVGMAAYFWIPALYEQRYITGLSPVNIADHFPELWQLLVPSWGTGFRGQISGGNEMSYQIGVVPLILCAIVGYRAISKKYTLHTITIFALWTVTAAFVLMLPTSGAIWRVLPFVHFVQYPWRLLSVFVIMTPVFASELATSSRFGWVIAAVAVVLAFGYSRPVTYEPRTDEHYLSKDSFTKGTSSLGDSFGIGWFSGVSKGEHRIFSVSSGAVKLLEAGPIDYSVRILASSSGTLTAPIAYYPGWQLNIDSRWESGRPDRDGLLTFSVPKGEKTATIRLGLTPWQKIAWGVSILSLLASLVSSILKRSL